MSRILPRCYPTTLAELVDEIHYHGFIGLTPCTLRDIIDFLGDVTPDLYVF